MDAQSILMHMGKIQFEQRMEALTEIMEYADSHSTMEDHDNLLEIISICAMERMSIIPDSGLINRLHESFAAMVTDFMAVNDTPAWTFLAKLRHKIDKYVDSFPVLPMVIITDGSQGDDQELIDPPTTGNP